MNREQQIRSKAKELGQTYFPDEANVWARGNIEAEYVESACVEMAEWLDQHPHWIPVENYPKDDISCTLLVHYVDGTIDICDYYGDYYDYTGQNVTRNVTHWMPLPQPPRKEE